jgi:hypothetical protein
MGLQVYGFPNMTAISQENALGIPSLKTKGFVKMLFHVVFQLCCVLSHWTMY